MNHGAIALALGLLLLLIGLWGLLTRRNLIHIVVGFSLFDTGIHVVIVALGWIRGGTAPILDGSVPTAEAASMIVDPVPQALVLTAIVIGLGVTALMLAYVAKLHAHRGSLEIGSYEELKW